MPLSAEQLANWFTYHPPVGDQAERYAIIEASRRACDGYVIVLGNADDDTKFDASQHDVVNEMFCEFVKHIDEWAPDSADKTAAIRCIRIARNAVNEFIAARLRGNKDFPKDCLRIARDELIKARWQANSAIACGGK